MKKFLLIRAIILLIISVLCDTANYICDKNIVPCGCGQTTVGINTRIVNGENAIPKSWPMMVSLRVDRLDIRHLCGGTILTESYILTAAHCVTSSLLNGISLEDLMVVADIHNLSQSDQIIRQVDKIIIHPLWEEFRSDIQYDIAILRLSSPLNLEKNSSITRTCLPPRSNTLEEMMQYPSNGTSLVAIGWGRLETDGDLPDILQQVTVNSIHHFDKICANTIHDPSIQFCTGLYEGGKGACYGDSGGPIFQWIGDRWQQVGITSYGQMGCATKGYPAVYTRISYFYDWIESHIHNNNQTTVSDNKTADYRALYSCSRDQFSCGCGRRNVALSPSTSVTSENALPYTWSMIVSVRVGTNNQHICSGTILEDSYIITAAHCLTNRLAKDITIEAGMYYRSESDVVIRQVDQIYIHPNYTVHSNLYMNDIAILHVSLPFDVENDENIERTCLSSATSQWMNVTKFPSNGTRLAISGWNIAKMSRSSSSQILQQAEVYIIDDKNSNCSVSNGQGQLQFCAGRYGNDQEMCYGGDFGDPIFQWTGYHWVQVGLASYCRVSDSLGVFTSLAAYTGWIESINNPHIENSSTVYRCDKKASCGCGQTDVNLTVSGIVGSENAIKHSWPMIVSLQVDDWHMCAGTILSDSFILTSATCVYYLSSIYNITVVAGIHTLSETVIVHRKVDKFYLHPNYSMEQTILHDIAIIHLVQPLPFNDIPSILAKTCVPSESESLVNDYPGPNSQLAVIGWDQFGSGNRPSDALQQISARSLDSEHKSCSSFKIDKTYQFCAEVSNSNKSKKINYLCDGGSGGPVLIYKNNHWEQVGIIPHSYRCNSDDHAEVYTRLSSYIEWMKNVTNSSLTTYSSYIEWMENVTNSSLTTYSSSSNNSGVSNQRRNDLIFEILVLLIVIFL